MNGSVGSRPFSWRWTPSDTDRDRITILRGWPVININSTACEPLARWTKGRSRIVTLNHSVLSDFLKLWDRWEREGLLDALTESLAKRGFQPQWSGGWVPRYKRGLADEQHDQNVRHLSNHSSGHAFDICAQAYPLGREVAADDVIRDLARVAEDGNWRWGGHFNRPDGMHFQSKSSPFP